MRAWLLAVFFGAIAFPAWSQTCDPGQQLTLLPDGTVCGGTGIEIFYVDDLVIEDDWEVVEDMIWDLIRPTDLPEAQEGFTFTRNPDGTATGQLGGGTTATVSGTIPSVPFGPPSGRVEIHFGQGGRVTGNDRNRDGVPDILCYAVQRGTVTVRENGRTRRVTQRELEEAGARC